MHRSRAVIVVICLALCAGAFGQRPPSAQAQALPDGVRIIWPDAAGSTPLLWPLPDGSAVPYVAWLIALPPQTRAADLSITIEEMRWRAASSSDRPAQLPPSLDWPAQAPPTAPLRVEDAGVMRGVTLARVLLFTLFQAGNNWRRVERLDARVAWPQITRAAPQAVKAEDALLRQVAARVLNPRQATATITPRPSAAQMAPDATQTVSQVFVDVAQPGFVQMTRAMLDAAGLPAVSPFQLRLRQGDGVVPMLWEGDDDALFEPGERWLFYAAPRFSRYADHDTWVLEIAAAPPPQMSRRSASPDSLPISTLRVSRLDERNVLYTPDCGCRPPLLRDGDRWAWVALRRGETWTHALNTAGLDLSAPASLTVWLAGFTDPPPSPDHRAQVWLNGVALGESVWDGRQAVTATFAVAAGLLTTSSVMSVTLPGLAGVDVEGAWIDAVSLRATSAAPQTGVTHQGRSQRRAYSLPFVPAYLLDVTAPLSPLLLSDWQTIPLASEAGARFGDPADGLPRQYSAFAAPDAPARVRPAAWLNPAQGNYHVIAHADLLPALASLVARRQTQGFLVVTQTTQALYDHYGDGRMNPWAIRAYLSDRYHAATSTEARPAYVLLVGDGSLDPRRYLAASPATLLPPFLAEVDPMLGETAADNRFATIDGDDALPDMAIGRWPVRTITETRALVSKTLAYEDALLTLADRRALFVADNADSAGNFPLMAQTLAGLAPASILTVTAAMTSPAAFTATRAILFEQWPRARLIAYLGHASPRQWAVERLLHRDDVSSLAPAAGLPVVIGLTCYTGRFHELQDALDETLVRAVDRGAVATWGSAGLTLSTGHEALGAGFVSRWLDGERVGDAAWAGLLNLAAGGLFLDLIDTYILLGDPALAPAQHWATHTLVLPVTRR